MSNSNSKEREPSSLLGGALWAGFGTLIALPPAIVAFLVIEFLFRFQQWGGPEPSSTDHIRFLFLTVPALFIFIVLSRSFPRGAALFANLMFAGFVSWRAWSFHLYAKRFYTAFAADRAYVAFEVTVLCSLVAIAVAYLSYSRSRVPR